MKKKFFGGEREKTGPWIIPGTPGWFYRLEPIDTRPGAINYVRHVIPGRPLRELARFERGLIMMTQ